MTDSIDTNMADNTEKQNALSIILKDVKERAKIGAAKGGLGETDIELATLDVLRVLTNMDTTLSDIGSQGKGTSTTPAVEMIAKALEDIGAKVALTDEYEFPEGSSQKQKGLVAYFGEAKAGGLAYSAHIDTVPATHKWREDLNDPSISDEARNRFQDPHRMHVNYEEEKRGVLGKKPEKINLIGRGVLDMKGALASMLVSLAAKSPQLENANTPAMLLLSSGEELGMMGAAKVAELAKAQGLEPNEIIVGEPTAGLLGHGNKGALLREVTITAPNTEHEKSRLKYENAVQVNFESPGFHTALAGLVLGMDPIKSALEMHQLVKDLRAEGLDIAVTNLDFGLSNSTPSDKSHMVISFSGTEDQQKHIKERIEAIAAKISKNNEKKAKTTNNQIGIAGFLARLVPKAHIVEGAKFGPLTATVENIEPGMHALSTNAAENALEYAGFALDGKSLVVNATLDKGYAVPEFGDPKGDAFVAHLQGNVDKATIYPASMSTQLNTNEMITSRMEHKEEELIAKGAWIAAHNRLSVPAYECPAALPVYSEFVRIAKKVGINPPGGGKPLKASFPSDANVLHQHFGGANIADIAMGKLRGNPHGGDENITLDEVKQNTRLYSAFLDKFVLGVEPERLPAVAGRKSAHL